MFRAQWSRLGPRGPSEGSELASEEGMPQKTVSELKVELDHARRLYRSGELKASAQYASGYLRDLLWYVHERQFTTSDNPTKKFILEQMEQNDLGGDLSVYDLGQFAKLFKTTNFLERVAHSAIDSPLIHSFDIGRIAELVDATLSPDRGQEKLLRLAVQQMLQLAISLSYISSVIELADDEFLDGGRERTEGVSGDLQKLGYKQQFFLFHEERGLLVNTADQSRNVAFKVETFVRLVSKIFQLIVDRLQDENQEGNKAEAIARMIIADAGQDAGERFGGSLAGQMQRQGLRLTLQDKIDKWCQFDSDVGFGRFSAPGIADPDKGELNGLVRLSENFLTLGRRINDPNICSFMKGYICGVLSELSGKPLNVVHTKGECAQFNQKDDDTCLFSVSVNRAVYANQQKELKGINMEEEL